MISNLRFLRNYLQKLPDLAAPRPVAGEFRRNGANLRITGPALVFAAGPTLDENLAQLRGRDLSSFWIFVVDAALKDVVAAGLQPHFVVSCDPAESLDRFYVPSQAVLLHEASGFSGFYDRFSRSNMFHLSLSLSLAINNELFGPVAKGVVAYGSVLNCAVSLAARMGSKRIVICGADCAYTGNRSHCRGWSVPVRPDVFVPRGNALIPTSTLFLSYAKWLEDFARSEHAMGAEIINATGAGILDLPAMPLVDAIARENVKRPTVAVDYVDPDSVAVQARVESLLVALREFRTTGASENRLVAQMVPFAAGNTTEPEAIATALDLLVTSFERYASVLAATRASARGH